MMIEMFGKISLENEVEIEKNFGNDIKLVQQNLDSQFEIMRLYILTTRNDPYAIKDEFTSVLFTAVFKNYISLLSALDLTLKGLYGSARIILRSVFEFLILSKTIAIKNDTILLNKWGNVDDISLRKDVFEKVKSPNSEEVKKLWKALCEFSHATKVSQQINFKYDEIEHDIKLNFVFIKMLLDMNYHVLNIYAANNSIQYYTRFAVDIEEEGLFISYKREIRQQINEMRKTLLKEPKRAVLDFSSKWVFK